MRFLAGIFLLLSMEKFGNRRRLLFVRKVKFHEIFGRNTVFLLMSVKVLKVGGVEVTVFNEGKVS
jgi:hypothetical protein